MDSRADNQLPLTTYVSLLKPCERKDLLVSFTTCWNVRVMQRAMKITPDNQGSKGTFEIAPQHTSMQQDQSAQCAPSIQADHKKELEQESTPKTWAQRRHRNGCAPKNDGASYSCGPL